MVLQDSLRPKSVYSSGDDVEQRRPMGLWYGLGFTASILLAALYLFVVGVAIYEIVSFSNSYHPRQRSMMVRNYYTTGGMSLGAAALSVVSATTFFQRRRWSIVILANACGLLVCWIFPDQARQMWSSLGAMFVK